MHLVDAQPPRAARWLVVLACGSIGTALVASCCIAPNPHQARLLQTLCLAATALAAYAWVLFPTAGSLFISVAFLLGFAWVGAIRRQASLGVELTAFLLILIATAWRQRRRGRRILRLSQVMEDIGEERTLKDQAIQLAQQTRTALQRKLSRYTQLQTIAEEFSSLTDLPAIAQLTVERTFALIGKSDVCLLFLVDQEQQELSLTASKRREAISSIRAKHGDQFDRYVLRSHRPLLVNDVRRDFRFTVTLASERDIGSVIACPLLLGQSPAGVLRLDSSTPGAYTQDDLRFLDILLDLVATAVTNAQLFARTQQLAMTDGLTGLALRRPFLEQLTRELTRAARGREAVSLLMLDIDHFKSYNDAFGHTAGDLILKAVAEVLRTVVPPGAMIARYGGEEFAVLLPRLPRGDARDVAEKIRSVVQQQGRAAERGSIRASSKGERGRRSVTVSIGIASFPDDAQAELELIRVADQRLYQAKRGGRNLVCDA